LVDELMSRQPASSVGWLATMPTCVFAEQTTDFRHGRPCCGLNGRRGKAAQAKRKRRWATRRQTITTQGQ
jgi:hypothetical protein